MGETVPCSVLVPLWCNMPSHSVRYLFGDLPGGRDRPDLVAYQRALGTLSRFRCENGMSTMADVRLAVVELDELQRMIVEAVRLAMTERGRADEWVDARSSGLGRRTFLRLAREGAFPVSKPGKAYVARRADVDAYLARQRIEPTPAPPPLPSKQALTLEGGAFDPIAAALAEGRLRLVKKPP